MQFSKGLVYVLTAILLVVGSMAFSQTLTTSDVGGTVKDISGAVVPGATVTITNSESHEVRKVTTSANGQYRFALLPPGEYTISATSPSLKSSIAKFSVLAGQQQVMDIEMKVQATQEIIEVSSEVSVLQTENANLTTSVTEKQLQELPVAGGDLTTVAMTVPGVRVNIKGGSGNMNANGVPGSSVLFTLNGADVMDPYNNLNNSGASNNLLGQMEVGEAAVVLNAFGAQYGRMAGGQVNLVGKSGTNSFHGNLLYNYNDNKFNANDFFNNRGGTPQAKAVANQYGASGGGPIKKDKAFFFADIEGLRYVLPSAGAVTLPTKEFQTYVLAHVPAGALPLYQDAFSLYNGAPGLSRAVPISNTAGSIGLDGTGNLGCSTKGTFKGTYLNGGSGPRFGIDVPCGQVFGTAVSNLNRESLFISRVDYNINDKHKLSLRYQYDWGFQPTSTSPLNSAFNSVSTQPQHAGQLNLTSVITPKITNSFITAFSWYTAIFGVADFAGNLTKMPARFTFSDGGSDQGGAFASVGSSYPTGRNVGQAQLIDDLSWSLGSHTLKFGENFRYNKITDTSIDSGTHIGTYAFADLADFATGRVNFTGKGSSFTQSFPLLEAAHIREYSLNFYVQDEWKVKPNLKLIFGMRFERDKNPVCVDNCFARVKPQFGTAGYSGGVNVPYNSTVQTGLNQAYAGLEAMIYEPRFSVAWSPFGEHKLVIRGGIGLFSNLFAGSVAGTVFGNSPNKFSPTVQPAANSNVVVDLANNPLSGAATALASFNAFESGFAKGQTLTQIRAALPAGTSFALPGYYSPPDLFRAPKILQWNLEIEKPLTAKNVLAVTYTGNHGYDESLTNGDANSFYLPANFPNGFAGLPNAAPDGRFLTVSQVMTAGKSNYDAMIVQLRHSYSWGFQGQVGYTWSHALGNVAVYNPYNLHAGYGNLSFDTRHQFTGDIDWNSPSHYSNQALKWIAAGWTVGSKFYVYSGSPFTVSNSSLAARINSGGGIGNTIIADLINPSILGTHCGKSSIDVACFTAASFATTTTQQDFGNIQPNSFWGTGYFDIDMAIAKKIPVREKMNFQLGVSFYNILNHPNFSNPSGTVTSGNLGKITGTVGPPTSIYGSFQGAAVSGRVMVLVGKFNF